MFWGALVNRRQHAALVSVIFLATGCGLVVGFQPREECTSDIDHPDCRLALSTGDGGSTGGPLSSTNGGSSGNANAASNSGGGNTSQGTTPTSTESSGGTGASGGSSASGGTGGSGGASTNTTTSAGGSAGQGTTTGAGGSTGGASSTADPSTSAAGGSTTGTTTSTTSTTGSELASLCTPAAASDATASDGAYPSALGFAVSTVNAYRSWGVSWLADDNVYYRGLDSGGEPNGASADLAISAGSRTPPVIGTSTSSDVLVAHGSLVSDSASVSIHHFNPLDPSGTVASEDDDSAGNTPPPNTGGIASRASTDDFLVAAAESDGVGRLVRILNGTISASATLGSGVSAIAVADLGVNWGVLLIQDGALSQATAEYDLSNPNIGDAALDTPGTAESDRPLSAVGLGDNSAAVAWLNAAGGISLAIVDGQDVLSGPVTVSEGAELHYPQLALLGEHLGVAWINAYDGTLRFKRYSKDLSEVEQTIELASGVDDVLFGFAADWLSTPARYAVVFSSGRLKFTTIACD